MLKSLNEKFLEVFRMYQDITIYGGVQDKNHRDQLIRDMIYVCCLPHLSEKNRREFLNVSVAWSYTDRTVSDINKKAKNKGCPYWSANAFQKLKKGNCSGLRHEHIVPRKIFVEAMLDYFKEVRTKIAAGANPEEIMNQAFNEIAPLMKNNLIGCVVTTDEAGLLDGKIPGKKGAFQEEMPDEAYDSSDFPKNKYEVFSKIKNPWARYIRVKEVTVMELEWTKKSRKWEYKVKKENVLSGK